MLGQRVVTAIVLLALLVPALWAKHPWAFAILTLALVAAAGWEWARLHGADQGGALVMGLLLLAVCLGTGPVALQGQVPGVIWVALAAAWVLGGGWALYRGVAGWQQIPAWVAWPVGLVALWAAWTALVTARAQGLAFVLSVLCVVWVADVAAYFGGRAFGRRKLAPSISPGKSWEGVVAGMAGVLALAWAWTATLDGGATFASATGASALGGPSLFSVLFERYGVGWGVVHLILLSGLSVLGDLFESLVKRAAGVKDSSRLLPGHGGVLDRIDALLPVFPLALALTRS